MRQGLYRVGRRPSRSAIPSSAEDDQTASEPRNDTAKQGTIQGRSREAGRFETRRVKARKALARIARKSQALGIAAQKKFSIFEKMDFHLYAWRHHLLRPHQFILMVCTAIRDAICNSYAGVTPIQEVTPREPDQLANLYSDDFNLALGGAVRIPDSVHAARPPSARGTLLPEDDRTTQNAVRSRKFSRCLAGQVPNWAFGPTAQLDLGVRPLYRVCRSLPRPAHGSVGLFVHAFGARDGHSPTVQRVVLDSFFNE